MSEFHVEVGAYALDALDGPEIIAFEEHLAGCETCQRELAEFTQTTALLSSLGDVAPPSSMRGSLLDAIREVRPLPPVEPAAPATPSTPTEPTVIRTHEPDWTDTDFAPAEAGAAGSGPAESAPTESAPVWAPVTVDSGDELARRRSSRRSRLLALAVAAVTVVALALGGWVVVVQQRQAVVAGQEAAATRLLSAPDVKTYPVDVGGTPATFVVSKSLDQAMFVGANLPTAAAGRTYQLWTVGTDKKPDPNVTFGGGTNTRVFINGDVSDSIAVAVSTEPTGGSTTGVPNKDAVIAQF